jgi:polysaccharide export outer membrane protein
MSAFASALLWSVTTILFSCSFGNHVHGQVPGQLVQQPAPSRADTRFPVIRDGLYVLQRGDEISIRVFRQPELDEMVRIRPDGKISIPLLDDIEAAGLTTKELTQTLTTRYAEFFREPRVSVIVKNFSNLRVYVGGEVGQPGPIGLVGDLTVVGAVFQAGGFKSSARLDTVVLIRNDGEDRPLIQTLNLTDVMRKGKPDIALRPFDVVYVPESRIRRVDRFVDEYIRQLIPVTATAGFTYLLGKNGIVRVP